MVPPQQPGRQHRQTQQAESGEVAVEVEVDPLQARLPGPAGVAMEPLQRAEQHCLSGARGLELATSHRCALRRSKPRSRGGYRVATKGDKYDDEGDMYDDEGDIYDDDGAASSTAAAALSSAATAGAGGGITLITKRTKRV